MTKNRKNKKAFTLLELLIVLAIIGLLVAIAIPAFQRAIDRAKDTAIKTTLARTREAGTTFFRAHGSYQGFCQFSPDWHRIRNTLIHEHQVSAERIHCLDSTHFFIVSSGLHTTEVYWIVDSHGRNSAGSSVRGLVAYWRFYEGAGLNTHDSSGQNNHGTLHNFAHPHGWVDNAISFDGVNDYIRVPNSPSVNVTGDITVEKWVRLNPVTSDDVTVHKEIQYTFIIYGNRYVSWADSSLWSYATFGSYDIGLQTDTWHHIIITKSGSTVRIYRDGAERVVRTGFGGALTSTTNDVFIGVYGIPATGGRFAPFKGLIDDVRIYNRALSAEEIRAQFEDGQWRRK